MLWRNEQGYTQASSLAESSRVTTFIEKGAMLGQLWMEGQFGMGDPLVNHGAPSAVSSESLE